MRSADSRVRHRCDGERQDTSGPGPAGLSDAVGQCPADFGLAAGGHGKPAETGNDGAFSQITYQPLKHAGKRGSQSGPTARTRMCRRRRCALISPSSMAERRNRYFFRDRLRNRAHRHGPTRPFKPAGLSAKVEPPRTPVITKIVGGDRQITISFASNREADLAEYRIYRADNARAARDIRLMTLAHTEPVRRGRPHRDRTTSPGTIPFWPEGRPISTDGVVDGSGNLSPPTAVVSAKL